MNQREPAGLQYDQFKVGQLIICAHGPVLNVGPSFSPYGVVPGGKVRNHQLVGSIYKIVGISGPFLALEPIGVNYRGHNVLADTRSGVKFQEVDQAFVDALTAKKSEPKQQAPSPLLGIMPVESMQVELSFLTEENYGVTPPSSGCGDPNCDTCSDEDEDDE